MRTRKNREINVFTVSFLDVFANTIGGLSFLLLLAIMMVGSLVFTPPKILTEALHDGYHRQTYDAWLGAREGLGKYAWSFGEGRRPNGLTLDRETGRLSGILELEPSDGPEKTFEFVVNCESKADEGGAEAKVDQRRLSLAVHREAPVDTRPLEILTGVDLPGAYRQQAYPLAFSAQGGQPPYTWQGTLPPGLHLDARGQVEGAPSQSGRFKVAVSVATKRGERQERAFSLEVSDKYPPPPDIAVLEALTHRIPPAVAEREYGIQLAAHGGVAPYVWQIATGGPAWLRRAGDDEFAGTPGVAELGVSDVVWEVRDHQGKVARTNALRLEVLPPSANQPPPLKVKTQSLPDARTGQPYSLAFAVEGGLPPYKFAFKEGSAASLPSLEFADGVLGGTPSRGGRFPIALSVADRTGREVLTRTALDVRPAPVPIKILSGNAPQLGRAGHPYAFAPSAVGGYPPYRWKVTEGALPPGLSIDEPTGMVSGAPERAGRWTTHLDATDAEGTAAEAAPVTIEVLTRGGDQPLRVTSQSLPTLLTGRSADVTLACEGGAAPYAWQASGALPAGLTIDGSRILGTPAQPGEYKVDLVVRDSGSESATASFQLSVRRVAPYWLVLVLTAIMGVALAAALALFARGWGRRPDPLRLLTVELPNARASFAYTVQLACAGGIPPHVWSVVEGELPPGLKLTPDGKLSGCPFEGISVDDTKDVPFVVEVRDRNGQTARQRL